MKIIGKLLWYAQRLRAMSAAELLHRVRERWDRLHEVSRLKQVAEAPWNGTFTEHPRLPWNERVPPELHQQLILDQQRLVLGEWELFGWKRADVGAPPCWHRDATLGVVVDPQLPSRRLDHRRLEHGADTRAIWEVNRWAEMTRMAMHSALNEDVQAIRVAQLWLEDWCERNPPGYGINWTSPLEAALRLLNFCWFDSLVRCCDDAELVRRQAELTARIVPVHAWWVWQRRSFGSSANNHLIGELAALVVATRRWPALHTTVANPEHLWAALKDEVLRQFATDGGNHEQALHYHLFAWEMIWQAVRVMPAVEPEVLERLRLAAQYFVNLAQAEEPWDFGDSDDAQVVPLALRRSAAVAEFRAWLLEKPEGATLRYWLGPPPRGIRSPAASTWIVQAESGMAIWRDERWTLRVDASPLGFGSMAAHGHLDALHTSLWCGPHALLVDSGTGAYYSHPQLRARLASWEAHNAPVPTAGRAAPRRMGAFLWSAHHPRPSLTITGSICHMDLPFGETTLRRAVTVADSVVEICDDVGEQDVHQIIWQLAPGWRLQPEGQRSFLCLHASGLRVQGWLAGAAVQEWHVIEREVSPHFRQLAPAPAIKVLFRGTLTTTWRQGT